MHLLKPATGEQEFSAGPPAVFTYLYHHPAEHLALASPPTSRIARYMVCRAGTLCHWACYEFGSAHVWVRTSLYLVSLSLCVLNSPFGRAYAAPGLACNLSLRRTVAAVYGLSACWIPRFAMCASQLWFGLGGEAGSTARLSSEALCHRPPTFPSKLRSNTTSQISLRQFIFFSLHSRLCVNWRSDNLVFL